MPPNNGFYQETLSSKTSSTKQLSIYYDFDQNTIHRNISHQITVSYFTFHMKRVNGDNRNLDDYY